MSNRFIYIQNCLQQDFWINVDPQEGIGVQVHNSICTMVSSQQKEKKTNKKPFKSTLSHERKQMREFEEL